MSIKSKFALTREAGILATIDMFIALLVLFGLGLHAWGIVMNASVVMVNDGVMPVVYDEPLFLIPEPGIIHRQMSEGNMLLFSDWIRVDFPDWRKHIPSGITGTMIHWWGKYLNYPFEGGINFVSIGDICRWLGSLMFLLGNMALIPLVLKRLYSGDVPKMFKE